MIRNARFHYWRDAQSLMNPAKIVIDEIERQRVLVILNLFRESIREAGKAAHHLYARCLLENLERGLREISPPFPLGFRAALGFWHGERCHDSTLAKI
jgi:hypothetical protein